MLALIPSVEDSSGMQLTILAVVKARIAETTDLESILTEMRSSVSIFLSSDLPVKARFEKI